MPSGESPQRILTVSELTLLIRSRLEQQFPELWVEGEVSNLRAPVSGHLYFTLKDAGSQIRVVLFRTNAHRLKFEVREGLQLLVRGRVTVYEPRGEYQLVLDYLEPKGVGALQLRFEQLKEQFAREGLFDPARKRPLPLLPRRIGLVTSPTGAAIRDMVTVIRRRCPIVELLIYPVSVQGETAAAEIAEAIRELSASKLIDVMIVGRGGGSWEDLWSFNEETVVRAIADAAVPVISAIGHETDFTLADFAADLRAPTPSAAAEAATPVLEDLRRMLLDLVARQQRAMRGRLGLLQHQVRGLHSQFPLMRVRVLRDAQHVDEVRARLAEALRKILVQLRQAVTGQRQALSTLNPVAKIRGAIVLGQQMVKRAEAGMRALLGAKRQHLVRCVDLLDSLSPLAILGRGYSILHRLPSGAVVKAAKDVSVDDLLRARLASGEIRCRVTEVDSER